MCLCEGKKNDFPPKTIWGKHKFVFIFVLTDRTCEAESIPHPFEVDWGRNMSACHYIELRKNADQISGYLTISDRYLISEISVRYEISGPRRADI